MQGERISNYVLPVVDRLRFANASIKDTPQWQHNMTKQPKNIKDEEGNWVKRSTFVQEIAEETNESEERVNSSIDDLIENGPLNTKEIGDVEYIQIKSRIDAAKHLAKAKSQQMKERFTRFL